MVAVAITFVMCKKNEDSAKGYVMHLLKNAYFLPDKKGTKTTGSNLSTS